MLKIPKILENLSYPKFLEVFKNQKKIFWIPKQKNTCCYQFHHNFKVKKKFLKISGSLKIISVSKIWEH